MTNPPDRVWVVMDRDGFPRTVSDCTTDADRDAVELNRFNRCPQTLGPYTVRDYRLAPQWRTGKEQDMSDNNNELDALRAEVERLRSACSRENDTISQVLGRALDYPRFADDQKNFPGATDANGVCIGDHVAASLADEAAYTIRALRAENAELASWQCIHRDGKTGLTHDECGNASCAKDRIIVEAKGELERLRAEVETLKAFERAACDLLPGAYYMDPPDGGDVSIIEQLRRMSEDAAKARAMQRLTDINQSLGLYDAAPQPPAKEGKT